MESLSKVDEPFPTPPPYFLPGKIPLQHSLLTERHAFSWLKINVFVLFFLDETPTGTDVRIYHIHSPFTPPPPNSFSFSPGVGCSTQNNTPVQVPTLPLSTPRPKFVSYETHLYRYPALTTCPSCQTEITTQVTFQVGIHAWLICLVFVLCGLLFGCCLIPFFINHFKDAYHTCPRCRRILHVHKKTCCE
ncbi:lipopolysaccharide-induced tumor necrosis factor-alpha factor homolog [Tautogolabrus adspersus]